MKSDLRILALLAWVGGGGGGVVNAYPDGLGSFSPYIQMGNFLIWVFEFKGSKAVWAMPK